MFFFLSKTFILKLDVKSLYDKVIWQKFIDGCPE